MADKETSSRIAAAGRHEILMRHTAKERAKTVEQVLLNIKKRSATPARHIGAMINLLSISLYAEGEHPGLSRSSSTLALQSALRALSDGHSFRDSEIEQIIKCALRHDILFGDRMGASAIDIFYSAFPKAPIFALLKLRALLNSGRITEATSLSLEIAPGVAPQETFAIAERAAGAFIEQTVRK
jgi:hypothetical protein